jgi:hypothetical protein
MISPYRSVRKKGLNQWLLVSSFGIFLAVRGFFKRRIEGHSFR